MIRYGYGRYRIRKCFFDFDVSAQNDKPPYRQVFLSLTGVSEDKICIRKVKGELNRRVALACSRCNHNEDKTCPTDRIIENLVSENDDYIINGKLFSNVYVVSFTKVRLPPLDCRFIKRQVKLDNII